MFEGGGPKTNMPDLHIIVQLCPFDRHSPSNPTDTKKRKSTVVSNFLPIRYPLICTRRGRTGGPKGGTAKTAKLPPSLFTKRYQLEIMQF